MFDSSVISGSTAVVGLIGYPARYSFSPTIHNAAYRELGLDMRYLVFPVQPSHLAEAMRGIRALGIVGVSVTTPHKEAVLAELDEATPAAHELRSVNCVTHRDGKLFGDSTDGEGFLRSLVHDAACDLNGKRVAILGAGGAARAILVALASEPIHDIHVINRSTARAAETAALRPDIAHVGGFEDAQNADIVINATSLGMEGELVELSPLPAGYFHPGQIVVDIVYTPRETVFLRDARAAGATTLNGLSMLVHQAARQIELWTGLSAPVDTMLAAVQAQ